MKKILVIVIAAAAFSCGQKNDKKVDSAIVEKMSKDSANFTTIQWIDSVANFGTIEAGKKVEVKFGFKNVGDKPLIITNVQASCGCTTPDWTKEPVAPGKEGWVTGIFNSEGKMGDINKEIRVYSNTKNKTEHILTFTGTVNNNQKLPKPIKVN